MKRSAWKLCSLLPMALVLLTAPAGAMHIMEGYLPAPWAFGWMAICIPFVVTGFLSIKKKQPGSPGPRCCWPCAGPSPSSSAP